MVTLKSTTQCPPNGFQYFQPETGWNNLEHAPISQWDFKLLCREIQKMRLANPRFNLNTDMNAIETEVKQVNALRMLSIPGAQAYIIEDKAPSVVSPKQLRPLRKLAAAAVGVNRLISGAGAIIDWLGHGGQPVEKTLAESRAAVCKTCPQNQAGDWFTDKASELIQAQIGAKNDLALTTSADPDLHTCKVCMCPMKLKVWTPLEHILGHMKAEVRKDLPAHCWILKER